MPVEPHEAVRPADALPPSETERRWAAAIEGALLGVWDHNFKTGELFYSPTWKRIRGMAPDDPVDGSLEVWIENVHPDDRARVLEEIAKQDSGAVAFNVFEYRERHRDGHWIWIESRGSAVAWDENGRPTRLIGTDTDITERKRQEEELARVSRRLKLALDISRIGVFEANLDTGWLDWDQRMLEIYGIDAAAMTHGPSDWEARLHPDDRAAATAAVACGIETYEAFTNEFRIVRPDGSIRHIRARAAPYTNDDGDRCLIGANWDVTADVELQAELQDARTLSEMRNAELEAATRHIEYIALHDHLTGLPNRRYLDQFLGTRVSPGGPSRAVLHLDLDRFKQINDTLGHKAGDYMLVHTARTLRSIVRRNDMVARIGGDEFVVLCDTGSTPADIAALCSRIIEALQQPVDYDGHPCRSGTSIGIAWIDADEADPKQALINADIALYRAKSQGRNRYEFFSQALKAQILKARRRADEILHGLETKAFRPVYQLQFFASTLEVAGVEALARWHHPEEGVLGPLAFLDIAAEIGALPRIDDAILTAALGDFARWRGSGVAIPRLSVNVSAGRLRDPNLVERLKHLDLPAGALSFELLESIFLDDLDPGDAETIARLSAMGIEIEIDDFGTGHASIVGLLRLRPKRLKIDRALVRSIDTVAEQRKLVGSIIEIGHSLGIEVVAEGVETMAHAALLHELGCDMLQGYALSRPMTAGDIEAFLASRRPAACNPVRALQADLKKMVGR